MTVKRCIKCGTIEDYLDIDVRCRHCKGALVPVRPKKSPDEVVKMAWQACDQCFKVGYHSCQRSVDAGKHAVVDTTCNVWGELTG